MNTMSILVMICIWVLSFIKPEYAEVIVLLSLFDWCNHWVTCYEWKEMFNDFLIGKWKWVLYVIKTYLIHDLYIMEESTTLTLTLKYKCISLFSSMLLVHINFSFSLLNSRILGVRFHNDPSTSCTFSIKSPPPWGYYM
jgi:hypothetical protein